MIVNSIAGRVRGGYIVLAPDIQIDLHLNPIHSALVLLMLLRDGVLIILIRTMVRFAKRAQAFSNRKIDM